MHNRSGRFIFWPGLHTAQCKWLAGDWTRACSRVACFTCSPACNAAARSWTSWKTLSPMSSVAGFVKNVRNILLKFPVSLSLERVEEQETSKLGSDLELCRNELDRVLASQVATVNVVNTSMCPSCRNNAKIASWSTDSKLYFPW